MHAADCSSTGGGGGGGGGDTCTDVIQDISDCATIIVGSQPYRSSVLCLCSMYQAANPTTALCPGMRCRTIYNNVLDVCADEPGVGSSLDTLRQALDTFERVGK